MAAEKKNDKPREVTARNSYNGFEVVFNKLTQRHIEKWIDGIAVNEGEKSAPKRNGNYVRAAFRAGWFELPVMSITSEADPILDWTPDRVNWLANLIGDKYAEVMYFDPS